VEVGRWGSTCRAGQNYKLGGMSKDINLGDTDFAERKGVPDARRDGARGPD